MLKLILSRPLICNFVRPFATTMLEKPTSTSFGDLRMPDKLYKMIELEMKSAEPAVLKSYGIFITTAAKHLDIEVGKEWSILKPKYKRWDLLKSVHIYRKHIVQYEVRTYYRWLQLHKLTGSTADTFLEYIERMLPEGVALKVTKVAIEPMPLHIAPETEQINSKEKGEPVQLESKNEILYSES